MRDYSYYWDVPAAKTSHTSAHREAHARAAAAAHRPGGESPMAGAGSERLHEATPAATPAGTPTGTPAATTPREVLLSRGRQVFEQHIRRKSSIGVANHSVATPPMPITPVTPGTSLGLNSSAIGDDILGQALRNESAYDPELEEARELFELATVMHTLLCADEDGLSGSAAAPDDVDASQLKLLSSRLLPLSQRVVALLESSRQQRLLAERAAADAQNSAAQVERKLELYKRQLQSMAESAEGAEQAAAERAAAESGRETQRLKAEKDEVCPTGPSHHLPRLAPPSAPAAISSTF
jgi:hypothetical protein